MRIAIMQQAWKPSIVTTGERIQGRDVTSNTQREGIVTEIHGPIRTPDCGGYRYTIRDDEGRTHIVYGLCWTERTL